MLSCRLVERIRGSRRIGLSFAGWVAAAVASGTLASTTVALVTSPPLTWSSPKLIDPGPTTPPQLDGVSCPSASLCVAVDRVGNAMSSTRPTGGASAWKLTRTSATDMLSVSCPSSGLCVAVNPDGNIISAADPTGNAGMWSSHRIIGFGPHLLDVSCPSVDLCVAVGYGGDVWTSTEPRGDIRAWTAAEVDEYPLYAVSCPSVSLCVAVDGFGQVVTSSDPTGGKAAWHVADIDPGHAILAVSCASASLCVAVDEHGDVSSSTKPTGGAVAWMTAEVTSEHAISSVSCPSERLCVAGGESGDILASTYPTGGVGAWSVSHVAEYVLSGVSCPSEALCVAIDEYGDVLTSTEPASTHWTTARVDASTLPPLVSVSCTSASLCVASDNVFVPPTCRLCKNGQTYGDVATSTDPISGMSGWRVERYTAVAAPLLGVSCPSSSLCVGAGEGLVSASSDPLGGAGTWFEELGWVHPVLFEPETEYFGPSGAVSCASASLCVADGDSFNDFNKLLTSVDPTGGEMQWHEVNSAHIKGTGNKVAPPYKHAPILGVSCVSASLCVAVDAAGNVLTSVDPTSSESTWMVAPVDARPLDGISCPSEGLCVAVDASGDIVSSTNPAGGSAAWTVSSVDSAHRLTAVSCATGLSLCVAVDDEGDVLVSTDPTGGSGAWSVHDVDSSPSVSRALTAVSCPSQELCVAVDDAGYAVIGVVSSQAGTGGGEGSTTQPGTGSSSGGGPLAVVRNIFRIVRTRVKRDGGIVLTLRAPGAGSFGAHARAVIGCAVGHEGHHPHGQRRAGCHCHMGRRPCRGDGGRHHTILYGEGSAKARTAGVVTLTIRPRRAARQALRLGPLRVLVTVTFTPMGGAPRTEKETVSVRRR
jgi:hypothetical protein